MKPAETSHPGEAAEVDRASALEAELGEALRGLPGLAARASERSADFWREQRLAISSRIPGSTPWETRWLPWSASVAAVLAIAVLLSFSGSAPETAMKEDPDHELLVDVERSLRRDVPVALEPATLLTHELHSAAARAARP
jgi:hypothetical protein